jgi:hypothetical protein
MHGVQPLVRRCSGGKQADGGDAGSSGGEAGGGVGLGDAAEGEDGDGTGGGAGFMELVEADSFGDDGPSDALLEDGAEEDEVCAAFGGAPDLGEGVAGDADGGTGAVRSGDRPEAADVAGVEFTVARGEVDAVGRSGDCDVGAAVDEEPGARAVGVGVLGKGLRLRGPSRGAG